MLLNFNIIIIMIPINEAHINAGRYGLSKKIIIVSIYDFEI